MQNKDKKPPIELFTGTKVMMNSKHFQTFGCPVFVLENELQSTGGIFNKWKERSKVGIYLGISPQHGRNVALVLSRTTGLVSTQFHVKFDPLFHSVEEDLYDSQWQNKAGFIKEEESKPNKRKKAQTVQTVENTEPPAQATRRSKTSEELIQASEGAEEDLMQEGVDDTQYARSNAQAAEDHQSR